MKDPRIVKEHDGRFAARSDDHPKLVGRGATEVEAMADFKKRLADFLYEEMMDANSYEDWSGRHSEDWKD